MTAHGSGHTDPAVAGATLHAALPVRAQVHVTRTKKFDHDAAAAFDHGWTLEQLVTRTTSGELGDNPGATITWRLEQCAENAPPSPAGTRGIPFCTPECRADAGWILAADTGLPARRCPCRTPQEASV